MDNNSSIKFFLSNPILSIFAIAIVGLSSCGVAPSETEKVTTLSSKNSSTATNRSDRAMIFAGSGTNLYITRILAAEFAKSNPDIKIEVPASMGSTGGISAIIDGKITVALASRPLKKSEKKFGLRVIPYAQTAVVIGVNQAVKDDNITSADLIDIYKGTKTRWSDGQEIIVLTREPGDSLILILEKNIPGFKQVYRESQAAQRWKTLFTDQEMSETLTKIDFAIGLSDTGLIISEKRDIKILKLNGIAPNAENVKNRKYPLNRVLTFVLPKEEISPEARAFIDFVRSESGAKILEANGYFPVK